MERRFAIGGAVPLPIGDPVWDLLSEGSGGALEERPAYAAVEPSADSSGSLGMGQAISVDSAYVSPSFATTAPLSEEMMTENLAALGLRAPARTSDRPLDEFFEPIARFAAFDDRPADAEPIAPVSGPLVSAAVPGPAPLAELSDATVVAIDPGSFDSGEPSLLLATRWAETQEGATISTEGEPDGNGGFGGSGSSSGFAGEETPEGTTIVNPGQGELGSDGGSTQIAPREGGGAAQQSSCTVSAVSVERLNEETQQWEPVTDGILAASDLARYTATVTPQGGDQTWWQSKDGGPWLAFGSDIPQIYLESEHGHWAIYLEVQQGMELCSSPIAFVDVYQIEIDWQPITQWNEELGKFETNMDNQNPPEHGGGWRWWAEKNSPSGPVHNKVKYVVQVTPADQGVPFYHKLFDVDDPTEHNDPDLDMDPSGDDNRLPLSSINNSEGQWVTGSGGSAAFIITLHNGAVHPGDNWRKVVAIKQDLINIIQVEQPSSTGALLNVGGHGVTSTEMISIWRTLTVELDHMGPPKPPEDEFDTRAGDDKDKIDCAPPTPLDNTCLPGPGGSQREPGLNILQIAYRRAYVEPRILTDAYNVSKETFFIHNLNGVEQAAMGVLFRDTGDGDVWLWTAYALSAYEGSDLSDNDPNAESDLRGRNEPDEPEYAAVFLETIRDMYQDEYTFAPTYSQARLEAQTLAHEISHQFEVPDPNPMNDAVRSIMSTVVPPNGHPDNFDAGELDVIRDQVSV